MSDELVGRLVREFPEIGDELALRRLRQRMETLGFDPTKPPPLNNGELRSLRRQLDVAEETLRELRAALDELERNS